MGSVGRAKIPNFTKINKTNIMIILCYIFSMIIYKRQQTLMCFGVQMINKQIPNIKHIEGLVMDIVVFHDKPFYRIRIFNNKPTNSHGNLLEDRIVQKVGLLHGRTFAYN
jgi:signal peptidase I